MHPYVERSIHMREVWAVNGWRLKLYTIALEEGGPAPGLIAAAREVAAGILPAPPVAADRYGVGFIGVHAGRGSSLVFVDWWAAENELYHHTWIGNGSAATVLQHVTASGLTACVWDLAVLAFERTAWINTMLRPATPDVDAYLAAYFEGWL